MLPALYAVLHLKWEDIETMPDGEREACIEFVENYTKGGE